MLTLSAILLFLVGLMHSALGGPHLINPILKRKDLPIILGSIENSRLTLLIGWHALTMVWWGQALVLLILAYDAALGVPALLLSISATSATLALAAIFLSRGRHLSWVFFIPVAVLTMIAAMTY